MPDRDPGRHHKAAPLFFTEVLRVPQNSLHGFRYFLNATYVRMQQRYINAKGLRREQVDAHILLQQILLKDILTAFNEMGGAATLEIESASIKISKVM